MTFTKGDLSYEKRPLTNDIAISVIGSSIPQNKEEIAEFVDKSFPYKSGELAAQADSCPVAKLEDIRKRVDFLKKTYEGFRIRHAQLSGVLAVKDIIRDVDDETAEYLIAAGSIAVIAKEYDNDSDKLLLRHGILPLISDEEINEGTFVLIRNIRTEGNGIASGKLEAYAVTASEQVPVNIRIGDYTAEDLEKIL